MAFSKAYKEAYQGLPERLATYYGDLSFDNHCYLRIAMDHTLGAKWDTKIERPAYRNLSPAALKKVNALLTAYLKDKPLLLQHNEQSLAYRNAWKKKRSKSTS